MHQALAGCGVKYQRHFEHCNDMFEQAMEQAQQSIVNKARYGKAQRLLQEVGTLESVAALPDDADHAFKQWKTQGKRSCLAHFLRIANANGHA